MSRLRRRLLFLVSALVLTSSFSAGAQYIERVDVSIANVDVVVTDREGNPVRGLTRDDFEVLENGKSQTITNFSAYDSSSSSSAVGSSPAGSNDPESSPPVPRRPRLFAVFIDIGDIDPFDRQRFFDSLSSFLDTSFHEGDLVTLLTWTRRLRVILPPTQNREQMNAVMQILSRPHVWNEAEILRLASEAQVQAAQSDADFAASLGRGGLELNAALDPSAEADFQEFISVEDRCALIRRKVNELESLAKTIARVDRQHVMVFASDDLALQPGRTCSTRREVEHLAATANAYGITIHALHPPGQRVRRVGYGPDTARFGSGMPGMTAPSQESIEAQMTWAQSDGLLLLANRTGGLSAIGAGMSTRVLERVAIELENYYSIGYRFSPGNEDKLRSINVRTKNRSYRVRTRSSVMRMSDETRLRDEIVSNLYLPVDMDFQTPQFVASVNRVTRDGRYSVIHLELSIRASDLVVLAGRDEKKKGSFSVFAAAGRNLGDASPVAELTQEFVAKADMPATIVYAFQVKVRPDSRTLSIAVRDDLSGDVATKILRLQGGDLRAVN